MRVVLPHAWSTQPWRNGGGVTHEIWRDGPADRFRVRVSLAEVATDGPFSRFEGVDRVIALVEGAGFVLRGDAAEVRLDRPGEPHAFAGEDAVSCALVAGPVRDLNFMVDRARASIAVERRAAPAGTHRLEASGAELLAFVLEGAPVVEGQRLPTHALVIGAEALVVTAEAPVVWVVARVRARPVQAS